MTNPNSTPNTPGLIRLCRLELERVRHEHETAKTTDQPDQAPSKETA